jgi:phosphatidylglycerophosphatase C
MAETTRRLGDIAVFDFDGTVVPGDSLVRFVARAAGIRRLGWALARTGHRVAWAVAGPGDRNTAKAAFINRAFRGLDESELAAVAESFASRLRARARPEALARIEWHRDQGHDVVLVSASLALYLEPFARALGGATVLATQLDVGPDGHFTGKLVGENVRGPEKVARLRSWLGDRQVEVWAYGDSAGDREMLGFADHAFWVRRGRFAATD